MSARACAAQAAHPESNRTTFLKVSAIGSHVVAGTMSVSPPATMAAATRIMAATLQRRIPFHIAQPQAGHAKAHPNQA
jgi:hypothetical protein